MDVHNYWKRVLCRGHEALLGKDAFAEGLALGKERPSAKKLVERPSAKKSPRQDT